MKEKLFLALLCGFLASCDEIKGVAQQAKEKVQQVTGSLESPMDKEAAAKLAERNSLVDQTDEGVVFRKDLPFPERIEVQSTQIMAFKNAFGVNSSELGRESLKIEGTVTSTFKCTRSANEITLTVGKSTITKKDPKDSSKTMTQSLSNSTEGKNLSLKFDGKTWQPEKGADFHSRAWADSIQGNTEELLISRGIIPRKLWFGKKRLKIGDTVSISQELLPMLFGTNGSGTVTLVLQSIEPLGDHPCGVFSISGDYSVKDSLSFDGRKENCEMTIQSGKVWLSLLYPLVLKEEMETVQTVLQSQGSGGLNSRIQGGINVTTENVWKELP